MNPGSPETSLRLLLDTLDQPALLLDSQCRLRYSNPAAARVMSGDSPVPTRLEDLLSPGDCRLLADTLPGLAPGTVSERVLQGADSRTGGYHARIRRVADGDPVLFSLTLAPVTAAGTGDEQFRQLVEASPSGIVVVDESGNIALVNRTLELCFGYTREELLGMPVENLLPVRLRDGHADLRRVFLRNPVTRPMGAGRDLYGARKDGSEFPVEVGLNPLPGPDGVRILAVIVDISRRKSLEREHARLQEKLQQAQKMESLGLMAGGVAHDFNNLLTGVIGNTDLALMSLPPTSPACVNLKDIQRSALRAAELCRQMLAYSGKGRFLTESVDLNTAIDEVLHLLESTLPRTATVQKRLHPRLPSFRADPVQIGQVVMNLLLNAAESLVGESGSIEVRTGLVEADATYLDTLLLNENLAPGTFVHLDVEDSGIGMDRLTLERIFDPFFTTKFAGRGLGLAAVAGIVRGHGGGVRVDSRVGRGTLFRVLFPCDGVERSVPVTGLTAGGWRGKGRVLVIEDEPLVRDVVRRILEGLGFEVRLCANGLSGLEEFERQPEGWRLVLLDHGLPDLDGEQVFRRIHARRPGLPVLVMSGHDRDRIDECFQGLGLAGSLQKPIRPGELAERLRELLEGQ